VSSLRESEKCFCNKWVSLSYRFKSIMKKTLLLYIIFHTAVRAKWKLCALEKENNNFFIDYYFFFGFHPDERRGARRWKMIFMMNFVSRDENFEIIKFLVSSFFKFISVRLWVVFNCSTFKVPSKFSALDIQRGFTFHVSFICSRCRYLSRKFIFFFWLD
jgi:hypothetical protein